MARGKAPAEAIPMATLQFILLREEMNKRTTQRQFSTRIVNTVKSWRRRWQGCYEQLCVYEKEMKSQGLSEHDYLQELLSHLRDNPRSGTRKRISLEEEQQIVALASEQPRDYGVEMTCWTHEMLAKVAIGQGIVEKISSRHVGNILKKANYTPTSPRTGSSPGLKTGKHSL